MGDQLIDSIILNSNKVFNLTLPFQILHFLLSRINNKLRGREANTNEY